LRGLREYDFAAGIHLYRYKEQNILLDVNTGAIHLLDELAYHLVEKLAVLQGDWERALAELEAEFPAEEIAEAAQEIEDAWRNGSLFSEFAVPVVELSRLSVKALCLNMAHSCNMKCSYCFASQGNFGLRPALMSLETAQKALDFLLEQSGERQNLEVDFFGGEPLLVFPVIKDLVAYAREREKETGKRFSFTLTTNCLLLNEEVQDFVIDHGIGVIMSLDGRKETHDRHRLLNNGQGSYELVLPKIQEMLTKEPVSYYVRGTFTRDNLDFSEDLRHMLELGFTCVSLEPAVGADNPLAISRDDLPRVLKEYDRLTDILLEYRESGQDIHFFHYNLDLQKGPCLAKRVTGCGAGIEYLAVTPEGDLYPCHQFVGEARFYMGNVENGEIDYAVRRVFEENQLVNKECRRCWARYFCGGGCHAGAYFQGDISKPHAVSCTMHKKRIEGAIYLDLLKHLPPR